MKALSFILLAIALVPSVSLAKAGNWACKSDAETQCADIVSGGWRVYECLITKTVSDACKTALDRMTVLYTACKADTDTLCSSSTDGGDRIRKCLKTNYDSLSDTCKSAVDAAKAEREAYKAAAEATATANAASTPAL